VIASLPGAVDLGGLPSGNRSASCIDFYFHGWVIWVSALQSQLGCHQGQLGRQTTDMKRKMPTTIFTPTQISSF